MQKVIPLFLIIISLSLTSVPARSADDPLRGLRQLSNDIYRLSQDMVFHGSEGHAEEIVTYGEKVIERADKMMKEIDAHPPQKAKEKGEWLTSLKSIRQKATEAVALARQSKTDAAVSASRKASFQAKQLRQQLQAMK